ncbi:MAG: hypothetical protein V7K57_20735 [Nostoc sp.]|uniref:hypothetical protein n=1 Tax=Nostoc sp. TaxID=1180 RepID=UPI002FF57BCB
MPLNHYLTLSSLKEVGRSKDRIHLLPPSFFILANQKGKNRVLKDVERYIPSEEKYLEAFRSIYEELTPGHKAILNKLYQHCYFMKDNRRLRTWELSEAAGYDGDSSGQIGHLGEKFCKFFGVKDDEFGQPALAIISWFADEINGYWYIELIPEAARAFNRFHNEILQYKR